MKREVVNVVLGVITTTLLMGLLFYFFIFLNPIGIYESNTLKWIPILIAFVSLYFSGKINKNTSIKFLPFLFLPYVIFKLFNYVYFPFILVLIFVGILALFVARSKQSYRYKQFGWIGVVGIFLFFLFNQPLIVGEDNFGYDDNGDLLNALVLWDFTEKMNVKLPSHTLFDKNKNEYNMAGFKKKTYFITFWATWCAPCMREKSALEKLKKEFLNNPQIEFVDVSFDDITENNWIKYLDNKTPTGLQLISKNLQETSRGLNFSGIPMHFIVNPEGIYKEYRSFDVAKNILIKNNTYR